MSAIAGFEVFDENGRSKLWGLDSITRTIGSIYISGNGGSATLTALIGVEGRVWFFYQRIGIGRQAGYNVTLNQDTKLLTWSQARSGDVAAPEPGTVWYGVY